jgi:hypothetical protein
MSQRYIGGLIYNPPGGFSGYFDGSGDYLSCGAANQASSTFTGDFTIEAWFNFSSIAADCAIVFCLEAGAPELGWNFRWRQASSGFRFFSTSVGTFDFAYTPAVGTWNHVALSRSGTNLRCFVNGVQIGTTQTASGTVSRSTANPLQVGGGVYNATSTNGYLSNVRIVNGTAVYTSAFDPPNGPLQAITNTSLLTCAYGTFRDGSTNNFTITVNGNTAVSTQNPFPLTTLPNPALGNAGNGVYSMSQYQSLLSQNLWPAVDPYWRYVTLMLHGNGTNGAQNNTFLDSSTNNFTITRNGNTTQGTFAPYGSNWSNYFDGSGDQLSAPVGAISSVGSSDFSIECFVYFLRNTNTFAQGLVSYGVAGSTTGTSFLSFQTDPSGYPAVAYATGSSLTLTSSVLPSTNQWTHLVVCRSGSTLSIFVNGVRAATTTTSATVGASGDALTIGGQWFANNSGRQLQGYISNARIVRGSSAYDATQSNITVPSAPLTAITNTSLLTCQSNRFIDNSTNAYAITVAGDTSVQRFSPFNPTAPYAAGTDGGSGYFDGSGDYIRVASNTDAALSLGTSDFTYEAWVYPTAFVSGSSVIGVQTQTNGTAGNGFALYLTNTGAPGVLAAASSGGYAVNFTGTAIPLNAWTHLAVTRSGNTFTLWRNGVSDGTATVSVTITQDSTSGYGGWNTGASPQTGQGHNGYIVDRLTKSGALYSTTFTPPSAPFTTTVSAGTVSLLCSMTNAGIIDNAEMNNLETVGNAQISTAQSKFGGASMAFDGTGDWLTAPNSKGLYIGSGDFTIEGWLYLNALGSVRAIVSQFNSNGSGPGWTLYTKTTNVLEFYGGSGTVTVTGTAAIAATTWTHFAVVRSGSTITIYVNGTAGGTATNSSFSDDTSALVYVGGRADSASLALNGYIDDLRITKGYARYTANFTPQRSQWQDQ